MRYIHLSAIAAVFVGGSFAKAVTIDLVPVGNPGNAANSFSFGAVPYNYQISRTEISNAQYAAFLNAADPGGANARFLYNTNMSSSPNGVYDTGGIDFNAGNPNGTKYSVKPAKGNNPVVWVSWNDAARFVNWLHNGQGNGSTESGVYDMSLTNPVRAANADYVLPNQNEWVKAGHFDPNKSGGGPGYWTYATRSDSAPTSDDPPTLSNPSNSANYVGPNGFAQTGSTVLDPNQNYLTDVGAYNASTSFYGTLDQNGNAYEWVEDLAGNARAMRGGSWDRISFYLMQGNFISLSADNEGNFTGFRVALVPEPGMLGGIMFGGSLFLRRRRASVR